jgi:hypothetical protein
VAQFDGDAATKVLRDALSKGYRDVMRTKKGTALAPHVSGSTARCSSPS